MRLILFYSKSRSTLRQDTQKNTLKINESSHNNLRLLLEAKDDHVEVEQLLDLVFTPRRKLLSSYHLRSLTNKVNMLSYVIKDNSNNVVDL